VIDNLEKFGFYLSPTFCLCVYFALDVHIKSRCCHIWGFDDVVVMPEAFKLIRVVSGGKSSKILSAQKITALGNDYARTFWIFWIKKVFD
jgi:hypothetical protein